MNQLIESVQEIPNVAIRGLSVAIPKRIVEVPKSEKRFKIITGIERRRICPPDMFTTDLASAAISSLLESTGWDPKSIGTIIVITQTPEVAVPSIACILHGKFNLPRECMAFDINLGCSGYTYGLSIVGKFLSEKNQRALLIVGETTGKIKEFTYAPMFGDAVSATALEYSNGNKFLSELMTDGTKWGTITERSLFGNPDVEIDVIDGKPKLNTHYTLKGEDIYSFSIREAIPSVERVLKVSGTSLNDIDSIIFHQANKIINDTLKKRLGLRDEQAPSSLRDFGNTSSCTIPLTMCLRLGDRLKNENLKLILCGFGVGLSWGTLYIELGPICSSLIEI